MDKFYAVLMMVLAAVGQLEARVKPSIYDDPCSNPRLCNGGTCRPNEGGGFFCECPDRFQGKNCEIECVDRNQQQCPLWSADNECTRTPGFMRKNCAKSCLCGCTDHDERCGPWSKRHGGCKKRYMKAYCRKSCGLCS